VKVTLDVFVYMCNVLIETNVCVCDVPIVTVILCGMFVKFCCDFLLSFMLDYSARVWESEDNHPVHFYVVVLKNWIITFKVYKWILFNTQLQRKLCQNVWKHCSITWCH